MPITYMWSARKNLNEIIDYVMNPQKCIRQNTKYRYAQHVAPGAKEIEQRHREYFCEGINCNVNIAKDEFLYVKENYGKEDGVQYLHAILSFRETNLSPEFVHDIGVEFANEVWGKRHQVIVATHLNTSHLHCHFVINNVSFVDGRCDAITFWCKFRQVADRICEEHGLQCHEPNRTGGSKFFCQKERNGEETRFSNMRDAIDYSITQSHSLAQFDYILKEMGYERVLSPSKKYWAIEKLGDEKAIRLKTLGENYTNDKIIKRIKENKQNYFISYLYPPFYTPHQYNLKTRYDIILEKSEGLLRLYLLYAYNLKLLPQYMHRGSISVHYTIRDDFIHTDKILEEMKFLFDKNISDVKALLTIKENMSDDLDTLLKVKSKIYSSLKNAEMESGEIEKKHEVLTSINDKILNTRFDMKIIERIENNYQRMGNNLKQLENDEKEYVRREKRRERIK